jgi:hypothetical protein
MIVRVGIMPVRSVGVSSVVVRSMGMIVMPVRVVHLVAARAATVRAEDGDQSREDRAEQRQEDNGLNHFERLSPSSG